MSLIAIWMRGWSENAFRLTGMLLQLGGVLTVVWGILKTREEFGQPTVRSQFKVWFKTFPRWNPPPVVLSVDGMFAEDMFGDLHLVATHGPSPDSTIEGRLKHLEAVVMTLDKAQGLTRVSVIQAQKKAEQELHERTRQLAGQIDDVSKKIEITATGGVHVSAVGVVLLFVGTIFGGAAPELSSLLTP